MVISKKAFLITYINLLLIVGVATFVTIKVLDAPKVDKRQWSIDFLDISCDGLGESTECGNGKCEFINSDVLEGRYCNCDDGYTHFFGTCDYMRKPQFNAFLASFFGGSIGADWFYLYYAGSNGGYPVAGVFKLLTGGGFSFWWLVDWIRVLTATFPDGNGMRLYENLTDNNI